MRKYRTVFMRGGTSKGCLFHKADLPADRKEWDSIFLQVMGSPDPKQIDGMGGTVSSNNKIVVIWKSDQPDVDIEYLVGQVIVGKQQVDYKSNCGNMTAAVPAFAVEEGLVDIVDPVTHSFAQDGNCEIAGVAVQRTARRIMDGTVYIRN